MAFNHYYQSELSALRELGRRFSERSPALAPFLAQAGRDPDVERLLEGFAFLTGRLRQKLDDELPELTHSLMHLLWPNYMRPLPAFSMLQFEPLENVGPAARVPRDTPVRSRETEGVSCGFRTCFDTDVLPLRAMGLNYAVTGEGAILSLRLALTGEGHLGELGLERLRLYLAGERYISQLLYLGLLNDLHSVELLALDGGEGAPEAATPELGKVVLPGKCVRPVGFAEEEALVPYPLNTFRGYRFLQEYFAFQDKFLFVEIEGLGSLGADWSHSLDRARGLELRFDIRRQGMQRLRPTLENLKLHCTPVVNLFPHDALPIRFDGKQDEYLLLPAGHDLKHCGVFSVDRVVSWKPAGKGQRTYSPFESFQHEDSDAPHGKHLHYSVRQRRSPLHEGQDTYLSFSAGDEQVHETLSVELTCTNQNLPQTLRLGDICLPSQGTPAFLRFGNITPVTPHHAPPLNRDFLWKLVSNMSLNYLSLANVEALKVILQTYDLPSYHDQHAAKISKCLLDGLKAIRHTHVDRLHRGLPVRGLRTELTIDPGGYVSEGELYLFASVLNEFFALYTSLNSYHELRVTSTQGEVHRWTPRMGQQPLL